MKLKFNTVPTLLLAYSLQRDVTISLNSCNCSITRGFNILCHPFHSGSDCSVTITPEGIEMRQEGVDEEPVDLRPLVTRLARLWKLITKNEIDEPGSYRYIIEAETSTIDARVDIWASRDHRESRIEIGYANLLDEPDIYPDTVVRRDIEKSYYSVTESKLNIYLHGAIILDGIAWPLYISLEVNNVPYTDIDGLQAVILPTAELTKLGFKIMFRIGTDVGHNHVARIFENTARLVERLSNIVSEVLDTSEG